MCRTWVKDKLGKAFVIAKKPHVKKYALYILAFIMVLAFGGLLSVKYGIVVFFAFLSIAVAAFGVGLALKSLKLTRESLELTRSHIRPFLTFSDVKLGVVSSDIYKGHVIHVPISNTGSLPAKEVSAALELFELLKEKPDKKILIEQTLFSYKTELSIFFLMKKAVLIISWRMNSTLKLLKVAIFLCG